MPNKGFKHSNDTKKQMREKALGRKMSLEARKKMSISRVGRKAWNKGIKNPEFCEEKHPMWLGDNVGYTGIHKWVVRWLGKPSVCHMCGTTNAKKYEWANIDHSYKRVLDDYIRMCTKCHREYDKNRGVKIN